MKVRAALSEDANDIADIYNSVVTETLATFTTVIKSPEQWAHEIADGRVLLVLEEDGQVLGYATFSEFRSGPGYAATVEHSIYLTSEVQGGGYGKRLLGALEAKAFDLGYHIMVAAISAENPNARRFHAACGYDEVGYMPQVGQKWGQWLDLLLMQKKLGPVS